MKKKIIYLAIIILTILFACSQKSKEEKNNEVVQENKTLTMAQKAEIKTLDPQKATDSVSRSIIQMINQRLVNIDNDGNIVFEIAKEIKTVDAKTTLVKIKDNIKITRNKLIPNLKTKEYKETDSKYSLRKHYRLSPAKKICIRGSSFLFL